MVFLAGAADDIPMKTVFDVPGFSDDFMSLLKMIFYFVSPLLVIWAATELGGDLLGVIRDAFAKITGRGRHDDDDLDYDESRD